MTAQFQDVRPGQPVVLRAPDINGWNAAARAEQRRSGGGVSSTRPEVFTGGVPNVRVRNSSGTDVKRHEVLCINEISDTIFDPADADALAAFENTPVLVGTIPINQWRAPFVITYEPIADGQIGFAYLYGVVPVTIDVTNEDHTRAVMSSGNFDKLMSSPLGHRILWKESGTGDKRGYIALGETDFGFLAGEAAEDITGNGLGDISIYGTTLDQQATSTYPGQILEGDKVWVWEEYGGLYFTPRDYAAIRYARATANIAAGATGDFEFVVPGSTPGTWDPTGHDDQAMTALGDFDEGDIALATPVNNAWFEASPRMC